MTALRHNPFFQSPRSPAHWFLYAVAYVAGYMILGLTIAIYHARSLSWRSRKIQ
ncbi:MAG: hypothetical protein KGI45_02255 [Patescibacteria group bacterium]|nr:hypothetical protein [Patescibacteria group bacterium]